MTLIVGIKCSDGIVMASGGGATFGSALGDPTVMQPVNKLHVKSDRIIVGASGDIGLAQLYIDRICSAWDEKHDTCTSPEDVQRLLRDEIAKDSQPAFATMMAQIVGPKIALRSATVTSLVAIPLAEPILIECDHVGQATCGPAI